MELLVLGLDGLSSNMLERFDPKTPFFDALLDEGISGSLRSVDPPDTFPAWTSFATGLDPSRHGVSNMVLQEADYSQPPVTPNTSDPAIYDLIPDATFINLQASYGRLPAAENTTLVAGKLAPEKETTVPGGLQSLPEYNQYQVFKDDEFVGEGKRNRPEEYVAHLSEILESKYNFANAAFEKKTSQTLGLYCSPRWIGSLTS